MKTHNETQHTTLIILTVFVLFLAGCATATGTAGRDFDVNYISRIEKGTTTTDQLIETFGVPYSKQVKSDTDEEWSYQYSDVIAKARMGIFGSMKVNTTGTQKILTLLIRNKTVVNYTYHEGPIEQKIHSQAYK